MAGTRVKLVKKGGTYAVPVLINGILTLKFTVDSGASDVTVPADVVITLMRTGTISKKDFVGKQRYRLADGRIIESRLFIIRSLKVGKKTVRNVRGSVAGVEGSLLLGQSFLSKFKSWSMDNTRHELVLE
jgi:predicted aspartyl protease